MTSFASSAVALRPAAPRGAHAPTASTCAAAPRDTDRIRARRQISRAGPADGLGWHASRSFGAAAAFEPPTPRRAPSQTYGAVCSAETPARQVLSERLRDKLDPRDDGLFYLTPRFVTHVDDGFIARLTDLYRERLPPGAAVLDLCSSWVSHLPEDVQYGKVVGHGLNLAELARNPRLDENFNQNLNKNQKLPLEDESFDAVLCCVSIQYLQYPEQVFAEVYRVLKPGGVFIVSFSDRMFWTKAIEAWRESGMRGRANLVRSYFRAVPGFTDPEVIHSDGTAAAPPLYKQILEQMGILRGVAGGTGDPFRAVVAYKLRRPDAPAPA